MAITEYIERFLTALERIATALESGADAAPAAAAKEKPPAKKPATRKTAAQKKAEENPPAESDGPSKEEVRAALGEVQTAHGPAAAKEVLAAFDATSIGKVKEDDYAAVIAACTDRMNETGDDGDDGEDDPLAD